MNVENKAVFKVDQDDDGEVISIHDDENPRSVLNLLPTEFSNRCRDVLTRKPELFERTERELRQHYNFDLKVENLRICFWQEYFRAQDAGNKMLLSRVYGGVMTRNHFYQFICVKDANIVFMLTPPSKFMHSMEAMIDKGLGKLNELFDLPLYDKGGSFLPKNAQTFLKAFQMVADRVHGATIQRVEGKHQILTASVGGNDEKLLKELEELEAKQAAIGITSSAQNEDQ